MTDIDTAGGGTTVQNLAYGYDAASNITSIGDNLAANRTQTFTYDNLNRTQKTVTVPFASTDTYTTPATSNGLGSISGGTARTLKYGDS